MLEYNFMIQTKILGNCFVTFYFSINHTTEPVQNKLNNCCHGNVDNVFNGITFYSFF